MTPRARASIERGARPSRRTVRTRGDVAREIKKYRASFGDALERARDGSHDGRARCDDGMDG